jgi:hypothetical protein
MPKRLSNKYPLVPSVQFRGSRLAPLWLMPAVPVRLGGKDGPQLYAAIDTAATISAISESTLQGLERARIKISKRQSLLVESAQGSVEVQVAGVLLVLCDPSFAPWVELGEVPFIITRGLDSSEPSSRILLGFDSCLAKLRVDIDYPRNVLTVHAPVRIDRRSGSPDAVTLPTAISEGERLIAMGSFRAAVAIVAAAVEEVLRSSQAWPGPIKNWSALLADPDETFGLESDSRAQLKTMWNLRNIAVHGRSTAEISKREAEAVLRAAKDIIAKTSKLSS